MTGTETAKPATRREWLGLAVLSLPTMLAMLDINVVILALPRMSEALHASSVQALWITDIYGFLIAGFLVTTGRIGDRVGYRKVLLTGAAAFGGLSLLAAFSRNAEMLIAIRALLGIAGATIMPMTLALIRNMFHQPKQMAAAMGVWSTAMVAGVSLGPAVGGLLLNSFWWGSVFLIGVPVMVLLLATGPALLPEGTNPNPGRLDFVSVALSLAAILPFIYGLKELARTGWSVLAVVAVVVGIGFGALFVQRQRRLDDPLLDLSLFKVAAISGGLVLFMLAGTVNSGNTLLLTQFLQLVQGYSPLTTALWLLLPAVIMVVGIQVSRQLAQRVRPAAVLVGGEILAAIGMVILTQVSVGGMTTLIVGICIAFAGVSAVPMLVNQLVMQSAPPEKAGSVGSLSSTAAELGTALGIAALGSLATAFYHGNVQPTGQVPPAALAAANDSLASAAAAAKQLPPPAGPDLLHAAQVAFTNAYNMVALISVFVLIGLAVLVYATLRQVPPIGADAAPPMPGQVDSAAKRAA